MGGVRAGENGLDKDRREKGQTDNPADTGGVDSFCSSEVVDRIAGAVLQPFLPAKAASILAAPVTSSRSALCAAWLIATATAAAVEQCQTAFA